MEVSSWLLFLVTVFIGSYIQAVAGFAMAMLIVAGGGWPALDGCSNLRRGGEPDDHHQRRHCTGAVMFAISTSRYLNGWPLARFQQSF